MKAITITTVSTDANVLPIFQHTNLCFEIFDTLHSWLKTNVYQHGRKFGVDELMRRATGGPMRIEPYMSYLKTKYGELYEF